MNMRTATDILAALCLLLALPALAARLVDAPPPPPIPDMQLEEDGTPKKLPLIEAQSRGQLLYENHCTACHESVAAIRANRKVKSLSDLRAQVVRWAAISRLPWTQEEVDDVVRHLDRSHYRF
jgi:mono/diheme cytochrome c family protein